MAGRKTRVLVVDDSELVRRIVQTALTAHPQIEVVGDAADGVEAIQMIARLRPDVVTLDVEMPRMNGIQVLDCAAGKVPVGFVICSTLTPSGAQVTFEALQRGAFDYVTKPSAGLAAHADFQAELCAKVLGAAQARNRKPASRAPRAPISMPSLPPRDIRGWVVAVGISCGGPPTLVKMLPAFPRDFPPILIAQHMPPQFTALFADHLNTTCSLTVTEASDGDVPQPGRVLIAPGDAHMTLVREGLQLVVRLDEGVKVSGHRPSVDVLFDSVARSCGPRAVGVIMTGMGSDGADGLQQMSNQGAWTIAQNEDTCLVFGMPRSAIATGCVDHVLPLDTIPAVVASLLQSGARVSPARS